MAADDIYLAEYHFEGPTSPASIGLHYQEDVAEDSSTSGPRVLAESLEAVHLAPIKNVLSDDWFVASLTVRKISFMDEPISRIDLPDGVGLRAGPALPANMSWLLKQTQALFGPKHNGRIYVPGLAESDTLIGVLTSAFFTGVATTLAAAFQATIVQISAGTGRWKPGVINRVVLQAPLEEEPPEPLDWEGSFSPLGTVIPWTIISSQRRRASRVIGAIG